MFKFKNAHCLLLCLYCFLSTYNQGINAQIVIGTPSLGFSQACANDSFNSYNTTFVFSPESALTSTNQFSIEMSDADGGFSNPEVVYTSNSGEITSSPATVSFAIPTTTSGENYKIRIKSTSPTATSTASNNFAAYYKLQDSPFTINNLIDTAVFCSGGSYILTIDNPGNQSNDSPLNYPSLTYNWFKETGPTTSVFINEGETLEVNEEGTFFVETNYGTCTSNSFSNRVSVTEVVSNEADAGIASSLGNPYCPGSGFTTLSTISGNSYQWFKDGEIITDAINQMYQTNNSGIFSVQVDLGECSAFGLINLTSELFEASINVDDITEIEIGESITIQITDSAINPQYKWFLNDLLLDEQTESSNTISEPGNYKVIISEDSGCIGSREFLFTIEQAIDLFPEVENIPNIVSPNGDTINDTWVIPTKYVSGTNTKIEILSSQGKLIFKTTDYLNNWPQNDFNTSGANQIYYYIITTENNETKKGTITIVK